MYGTLVTVTNSVDLIAQKQIEVPQVIIYDLQAEPVIAVERNAVFDIRYIGRLKKTSTWCRCAYLNDSW